MTAEPTDTPTSGAAKEQPPHGENDRPKTTVYKRGTRYLWIFWPSQWQLAEAVARQDFANGAVVYQVEIPLPDGSTGIRTFPWGQDSVRPA